MELVSSGGSAEDRVGTIGLADGESDTRADYERSSAIHLSDSIKFSQQTTPRSLLTLPGHVPNVAAARALSHYRPSRRRVESGSANNADHHDQARRLVIRPRASPA